MVPQCYMLLCPCVYGLQQYGHLRNSCPLCFPLHGPSMFAVRAKIYGVLYNQASSIAFDEISSYWSALKRS